MESLGNVASNFNNKINAEICKQLAKIGGLYNHIAFATLNGKLLPEVGRSFIYYTNKGKLVSIHAEIDLIRKINKYTFKKHDQLTLYSIRPKCTYDLWYLSDATCCKQCTKNIIKFSNKNPKINLKIAWSTNTGEIVKPISCKNIPIPSYEAGSVVNKRNNILIT